MFDVLSLIGGGIFRLFPSVLEFFKQKRDLKHELALLEKTLELEDARWKQKEKEIQVTADMQIEQAWASALPAAMEIKTTGVKFVDAFNASVRPILTYWWCLGLYTAYKIITVYVAYRQHTDLAIVADLLVTEFDRAVIGSIFGFWFLDRALRKKGF